MPFARQQRCGTTGCGSECLTPRSAAPVVIAACTLSLFVPFVESTSLKLNSVITDGLKITYFSILIFLAWLASIFVGCIRRHEDSLVCFFDSMGVPGLVTVAIYGVKVFTSGG